jgi:hypothetical protein
MESEVAYEWTELRIVRSVVASARKVLEGQDKIRGFCRVLPGAHGNRRSRLGFLAAEDMGIG